jgi:hypothetical protein
VLQQEWVLYIHPVFGAIALLVFEVA